MAHSHHHHSHHHDHHHGHHHDHHHDPGNYNQAFKVSVALNVGFVIIEAAYGIFSNSLALLADAGHNLSDVLGLLLAWGASMLAQRQPTPRRTFGLRRASILAALLNSTLLLVACGGIGWEAIQRFRETPAVAGQTVIVVAIVGILINGISAMMFVSGRDRDLNIRGAFLHLAADAVISLGVALAGIAIVFTKLYWIDPVISLIVTGAIVLGTWALFRDSFDLLVDAVPHGIEPLAVRTFLAERPGVREVHDLHIWAMSTTETALTVHLVMPEGHPGDAFLSKLYTDLHDHFGVKHATIQIELGDCDQPCALAPEHVV